MWSHKNPVMSIKKILVPTDFTEVAECAEHHALKTAEIIGGEVHLLHVVENQEEIEEAREKLEKEAESLTKEMGSKVPVKTIARIGNIFDDIGDTATELDAEMIFMGTHGMKGVQYITGSYALRVITHASAPFVVVQEKDVPEEGYDDIVVPLDLSKETKQKLSITANMARYFNSNIHLITPKETDPFLKNQLTRNLNFAKNYLEERGIKVTTTVSEERSGNFPKKIINHATQVNADLITIMNLQENSLMGILGSSYEQQLITNDAQIPVMCINPQKTTRPIESILAT